MINLTDGLLSTQADQLKTNVHLFNDYRQTNLFADVLIKSLLLFCLNLVDALLTIYWIRNNMAAEGNVLMAVLLDHSEILFVAVKAALGVVCVLTFCSCYARRLARLGLTAALAVYSTVMLIHLATAISSIL